MSEKRVFEGVLCNPDQKWYLDDENITTQDEWFNGLWNKHVRITIEVLDDTEPQGGG
jgi:hypothetical protein